MKAKPISAFASAPAALAATWLLNQGKDKHGQWYEGQVTAKIDSQHLQVKTTLHASLVKLPVKYMTCDAEAFKVGDYCLIFAPACVMSKSTIIGFTRQARSCLPLDCTVYGITGNGDVVFSDYGPLNEISVPPPWLEPNDSVRRYIGVYRWDGNLLHGSTFLGPSSFTLTSSVRYTFELEGPLVFNDLGPGDARSTYSYRLSQMFIGYGVNGATTCRGETRAGVWSHSVAGSTHTHRSTTFGGISGFNGCTFGWGLLSDHNPQTTQANYSDAFFPMTSWAESDGDAGESFSLLYFGKHSATQHPCPAGNNYTSRPERRTKPGGRWFGCAVSIGATDADTVVTLEGTLDGSATSGVLVYAPATGAIQEIWTPAAPDLTVKTLEVTYDMPVDFDKSTGRGSDMIATHHECTENVLNIAVACGFSDAALYGSDGLSTDIRCLPHGCSRPAIFPVSQCDYHNPGSEDCGPPCGDVTAGVGGPVVPSEVISIFTRYVHSAHIQQELVAGCISPVIRVHPASGITPAESYVLVPAIMHESQHVTAPEVFPGWAAGATSWGNYANTTLPPYTQPNLLAPGAYGACSPNDYSGIANKRLSFQGELQTRQRLYSVRVETMVSSLAQDDDILVALFEPLLKTNTRVGEKTIEAVESNSKHWAGNYVQYADDNSASVCTGFSLWPQSNYRVTHDMLANWWSVFHRCSNYRGIGLFTETCAGVEPITPFVPYTYPFVCPVSSLWNTGATHVPGTLCPVQNFGARGTNPQPVVGSFEDPLHLISSSLDNCVNVPCGNWQPMIPDDAGSVAAWVFRYVVDQHDDPLNDHEYVVASQYAQYPHEQVRKPIAHGDSFWIYSAKTGLPTDKVITGVLTNPGSYLRHPCITPDGTRLVFTAHGYFTISGFDTRFYAGMYLLDRTDPMNPILILLSPVELRYPGRSLITYRGDPLILPPFALATGNELTIDDPSGTDPTVFTPDVAESQLAYHVGQRRKSFSNHQGTGVLCEGGMLLDLQEFTTENLTKGKFDPTRMGIINLLALSDVVGMSGHKAETQNVDLMWRGFWATSFWNK